MNIQEEPIVDITTYFTYDLTAKEIMKINCQTNNNGMPK